MAALAASARRRHSVCMVDVWQRADAALAASARAFDAAASAETMASGRAWMACSSACRAWARLVVATASDRAWPARVAELVKKTACPHAVSTRHPTQRARAFHDDEMAGRRWAPSTSTHATAMIRVRSRAFPPRSIAAAAAMASPTNDVRPAAAKVMRWRANIMQPVEPAHCYR